MAQQTGSVVGQVTDRESGEPLPGANITIKNLKTGASSDLEGLFVIENVPAGSLEIVSSYVGYYDMLKEITVNAGERTLVNFAMDVSILELDAIVVTGTGGDVRKKELTTSISTINSEEIKRAPVESIDHLLMGRVAGALIEINAGMPGTGSRIRLRGVKSVNSSQTPIIYVDGIRIDNNDNFRLEQGTGGVAQNSLADILVEDIDKIEVLKGGAAATLYGSEASNGIIQVFTKKGSVGPPRVSFRIEQGINTPDTKYVQEEFTKKYVLENGHYQKYSMGLSGGLPSFTYHLSGYLLGNDGVMLKDLNQQYSFRAGMRLIPAREWQVSFSGGYVRDNYERMYNNNAIVDLYGSTEQHNPVFFGEGVTEEEARQKVDEFNLPDLNYAVNRFNLGSTVEYEPNPVFKTRLTLGLDYRKNEERQFIPIAAGNVTGVAGGGLFRSDREYMTVTIDFAGSVRYPQSGLFNSYLTFGAQGFRIEDRESNVTTTEFGLPGTDDFDNTANQAPLESNRQLFNGGIFMSEQVGFKDRLFLNLALRLDGNTTFGDNITTVLYPKFGLAYNLSEESFWQGLPRKIANYLKFRASYGETGNYPTPFTRDKTFIQGPFLNNVSAGFGNPGNLDLKPERTKTYEIGLDASLVSEMFGLEATYYIEKTVDALFLVPNQPTTGLANQLTNVGTIENKGIELGFDAKLVDASDFELTLQATYTHVVNTVTDLGGSQPFSIAGFSFLPQRVEEGKPVGIFRTNIPNADGSFDTVLDKSPLPDYAYSMSIFSRLFKNWTFAIRGDGQVGGYSANLGKILRILNGGEVMGEQIPDNHNFVTASDIFIEDATYFKMREISLSYSFPEFLGAHFTLQASARNVFVISNAVDFDPELNGGRTNSVTQVDVGGININTVSPARQFRLILNANF